MSEFMWTVCFDDDSEAGVSSYAIEACETESEAAERAQKRNEVEGFEDHYYAAELEPDALGDQDLWAMAHHGTAVRIG